jgi:hypothetical protein
MKLLACTLATLIFVSCALGSTTGENEFLSENKDSKVKIKIKGDQVRIVDKSKPIRHALEEQYEKMSLAYFQNHPEAILALRTPDFQVKLPNGRVMSAEESEAYVKASFEQVQRNLHVSFDIVELTTEGDVAIATIHQQWDRVQEKAGQPRMVETEAIQREWWVNTEEGWRLFLIDHIRPGVWKVDGKRVDPSKPYDPDAPPFREEN